MPRFLFHPILLMVLRIALGSVFVLSGALKLMESTEDFLRIVDAFEILPSWTPFWFYGVLRIGFSLTELTLGCLVVLSVQLRWALWGVVGLLGFFMGLIVSAMVRGIPIVNCGCFGSSELLAILGESDMEVLVRDGVLVAVAGWLLFSLHRKGQRERD